LFESHLEKKKEESSKTVGGEKELTRTKKDLNFIAKVVSTVAFYKKKEEDGIARPDREKGKKKKETRRKTT